MRRTASIVDRLCPKETLYLRSGEKRLSWQPQGWVVHWEKRLSWQPQGREGATEKAAVHPNLLRFRSA